MDEVKTRTSLCDVLDIYGEKGAAFLKRNRFSHDSPRIRGLIEDIQIPHLRRKCTVIEKNNLTPGETLKTEVQVVMLAAMMEDLQHNDLWSPSLDSDIFILSPEQEEFKTEYALWATRFHDALMHYVELATK